MKILIVGVLDNKKSTNVQIKKAFIELGHEVIDFNYRTIADEFGYNGMEGMLIKTVKDTKPDVVFICKGSKMSFGYIDELNKLTKTFFWWMDPLATMISCNALEYAKRATWCAATSKEVVNEFKKVNEESYKIFEGYNPEIFKPLELDREYDVFFAGSEDGKRRKIIDKIISAGINIKLYGCRDNPKIVLDKLNREMNRSKIVLNVCRGNIFSNRVMEALGAGCFLLTDKCDDLVENFVDGEDLAIYKDEDECVEKIKYYLENVRESDVISSNGYNKVKNKFTWKKQVEKFINIMKS
jgi:glycosyltransferase involved in cell wall biosynthesis